MRFRPRASWDIASGALDSTLVFWYVFSVLLLFLWVLFLTSAHRMKCYVARDQKDKTQILKASQKGYLDFFWVLKMFFRLSHVPMPLFLQQHVVLSASASLDSTLKSRADQNLLERELLASTGRVVQLDAVGVENGSVDRCCYCLVCIPNQYGTGSVEPFFANK